jgi:hypothetical protein
MAERLSRHDIQWEELHPRVDEVGPELPTSLQRMASLKCRTLAPTESIQWCPEFYPQEGNVRTASYATRNNLIIERGFG